VSLDRESVAGHWVHAHEEDADDEMVLRPAGTSLPPSRGRAAFDLRADGTYTERAPGPDDRPVECDGTWSLEGDELTLAASGDEPGRAWTVRSAESGRLCVTPRR
jgi:hypothetical protein